MKTLFVLLFVISCVVASTQQTSKNLHQKNLQDQIEKEKKYATEQKFYMGKDYDLKSFEVDTDSLKNIPNQPDYNEDFDMDSVYD